MPIPAKVIHIYNTDGSYLRIPRDKKPTLQEMQSVVGGYIECLKVTHEGHTRTMVVNEEGLILGFPDNPEASEIAGRPIVGNAIVLEGWKDV